MNKHREQIGLATRKAFLTLAFAFSTVLMLIAVLPSTWVRAQSEHIPCILPSNAPSQVFALVPQIPQLAPSDVAVGIFVTHTFSIALEGDEIVCLASSPDGRGALRVDDQIDLQVIRADGSKASWMYNFSVVTGGITNGPSQDVSRLFSSGRNNVLIFLTDLAPKYHSAEPIWLIIWEGPTPKATTFPTSPQVVAPATTPTETVGRPVGTPTLIPTPSNVTQRNQFDSVGDFLVYVSKTSYLC